MHATFIKKAYEKDLERLLRYGTLETDGNSARYLAGWLSRNKLNGGLKHFHNNRTKRSILIMSRRSLSKIY